MKYYLSKNLFNFDFNNYHNAIMSKEKTVMHNGKIENIVLQPFIIISLMALNGNCDFDASKFT